MVNIKTKLKTLLKVLIIITFEVLYFTSCGGGTIITPPDGDFAVTTAIGTIKGKHRIYADQDWLQNAANDPSVFLSVAIDSQYRPANCTLIWIVADVDDPADDIILDSNGSEGDDNIGEFYGGYNSDFEEVNHGGAYYQDSMYVTSIDACLESSVEVILPPDLDSLEFKCGDNIVVSAKIGSIIGNSLTTPTITLWKRLCMEYDTAKGCAEGDSVVFDRLVRAFAGTDIWNNWNANNCPWIEVKKEHLLMSEDTVAQIVPKDPLSNQLYLDLKIYAMKTKNDQYYHPVHLLSVWYAEREGLGDTTHGGSTNWQQDPEPRAWSYLFMRNIKNHPPSGLAWDAWKGAVAVHELGHQIGRIEHEDQHSSDCIMRAHGGPSPNSPLFCPYCVKKLRWGIKIFK
ncbi:MAG: hypothetical protein ABIL74_10530 [candidate division WOR-3 bacterium]